MDNKGKSIKKILFSLFNTKAAGLYLILFAVAIAIATFIENDYGTSAAQKLVFKSKWFELLLVLFSITILVNIVKFKMIKQKRWALLLFHLSMIIILIGSGVTRYFSFEGIMHIRENNVSNVMQSADTYLIFDVETDNQSFKFDEQVLFASLGSNNWHKSYLINNDLIEVELEAFIPNPKQNIINDSNGTPILKIVVGGRSGREEYYIEQGETKRIQNVIYNFNKSELPDAINIDFKDNEIWLKSDKILYQTIMATQTKDTLFPNGQYYPLRLRSLYTDGVNNVVFGDFRKNGKTVLVSEGKKVKSESMTALRLKIKVNGSEKEALVFGKKGLVGRNTNISFDKLNMSISYGSKQISLPFSLKLFDFIMTKYPGTMSASSYASEVQLIDDRNNLKKDYRIYMNHILDHDGYRFFQSSFDKDERGTYLSVNHDFWGTWISYIGYIFLTIGLILSLFNSKSRFRYLSKAIAKTRAKNLGFLLVISLMGAMNVLTAQSTTNNVEEAKSVDLNHADIFSKLIVQDHKGRMKPIHTMSREVMRKLLRKETYNGLNADQVFLSMYVNSAEWETVPLIKLGKHKRLKTLLDVSSKKASYNDFFNPSGSYKLKDEVRRAYSLQPIDRGVYEKELMKIDEKVNIASMVFSGRLLKIIPLENSENNVWVSNYLDHNQEVESSKTSRNFFNAYQPALLKAMNSGDYNFVDKLIEELDGYQQTYGSSVIPSRLETKAEIILNEMNVFGRLAIVYILLGLAFLFILFVSVFKPNVNLKKIYKVLFAIVLLGFVFHTLGLGLRWFVSGRAPWSNGYESMIYIAWTSTLAGLLFTRKSLGGLAATMVLAATVLLVAHLSYLDPEITPLVPVLKSYWLTIHVSLEAGSYGFLMLGALIGLINLILMIFLTHKNKNRVYQIIKEMSYISEMTLIGGLIMLCVGTYLGGVWANESWGRYWGWDAKETWALVSILVYAFILHMRLIPKINGLFAFNLASIFGWASVIMTYYGVNYYLSGLHSYAAGDPIPVPNWVYYTIVFVFIIAVTAYLKKRKIGFGN